MDFRFVHRQSGTLRPAVTMELFERLAYSGMVTMLGIYGRFVNPNHARPNETEAS
ncbi:MAG: hypothetical protein ACC742_01570 [Thermoanaerobaculales bacterium]